MKQIITERWNDVKGVVETLILEVPQKATPAEIQGIVDRFLIDPNVSKIECGEKVWYGSFVNPINVL